MAGDALATSMYSGVFLIVATILFGLVGGTLLQLGGQMGQARGARIGLAVGLGVTVLIVTLLLRRYSARIILRSINLYRGMWIGMWISLAVIILMAYLPHIVLPMYCPPGAPCEFQNVPPPVSG